MKFVKVFIPACPVYKRVLSLGSRSLFDEILYRMNADNRVYIGKRERDDIAEKLNVSAGRLSNMITELVRNDFMYRQSRGYFFVNPYLAVKDRYEDVLQREYPGEGYLMWLKFFKTGKKRLE